MGPAVGTILPRARDTGSERARKSERQSGNDEKAGTRTGARQGGEDKNVDWPQIESRPFITRHLPCPRPSALLRFGTTVNKNRNDPRSDSSSPSSFPPSSLPPSRIRIEFLERLDRVSCGKDSHQFAEMYVDISYTCLTYIRLAGWKSFLVTRGQSGRFTGM